MRRSCIGLAALCLIPAPAFADGGGGGCGGDAYSFVEVAPARRAARPQGPIVVMPDTFCADLAGGRNVSIESLNIVIDPRRPEEGTGTGITGRTGPSRSH